MIEDALGRLLRDDNFLYATRDRSNRLTEVLNSSVLIQVDKGREVTSDLGLLEIMLGPLMHDLEQAVVEGTVSHSSGWLGGMQSQQEHAAQRRRAVQ